MLTKLSFCGKRQISFFCSQVTLKEVDKEVDAEEHWGVDKEVDREVDEEKHWGVDEEVADLSSYEWGERMGWVLPSDPLICARARCQM